MIAGFSGVPDAFDQLGVLSVRLAPDGTVADCNEAVAETVGLTREAIQNRHHQAIFGSLDVSRATVAERTLVRPDGEPRRIRWCITPAFDNSGAPDGLTCIGVEIPIEPPSIAMAEALIEKTSEGVLLIDGSGQIQRINHAAARMFAIDEADAVGMPVTGLMPDRYREHHEGPLSPYPNRRHESSGGDTLLGLKSSGDEFPISLRVEEVDLEEGGGFVGFARDETANKAAQEKFQRQAKHLKTIRDVMRSVGVAGPLELARRVLAPMAELLEACAAAIVVTVDGVQHVECFGLPPETAELVNELLPLSNCEPARLQALTRLHVLAAVPLVGLTGRMGEVMLFSPRQRHLDGEQCEILENLAKGLTVALEHVTVTRELTHTRAARDSAHESILRAMVAALDLRDHETEGHTQRVTRISVQLGERLGLDHDELRNLEHGSLLHDVGKIGIPDAILHKPGPLTSSEWDIMRRHPQYAFDILSPLPHLAHALDVPFCHHERYDGSGYPRGLRGHEIPLPARIFAVVDVYDAMTTERPYRPALPAEFAISHLRSHAGTHFDPVVIEAFCLLAEGWTDSEPVQAVP